MKSINKFSNWVGDPKNLIDEFLKDSKSDFSNVKKAKETLGKLTNELNNIKNKNDMNTKDLTNYKPYSIGRFPKDGYADICFQSEGIMTVPRNSAQAIVDMLNDAFKNGVKMTLNNTTKGPMGAQGVPGTSDPVIKSKPMPQEEPHPINTIVKSLRR